MNENELCEKLNKQGEIWFAIERIKNHLASATHITFNHFYGTYTIKDSTGKIIAEVYGMPCPDKIPHIPCALDEMRFDTPGKMTEMIKAGKMVYPTALSDKNDPLLKLLEQKS